jgi:two-component system alkaline phosphatase synthesis response regulator PhoP
VKNQHILILEDDPAVLTLTRDLLLKNRYQVQTAGTLVEGKLSVQLAPPELVVLDLGLPDGDGLAFCRDLKRDPLTHEIPVFILTARGSSDDIVAGLEAGADDYLPKPFNEREFLARARTILRRKGTDIHKGSDRVSGHLKLNLDSHEAWCKGKPVELTLREFEILQVFLDHPGKAMGRDDIVRLAWGPTTAIVPRVVDVHVGHLRNKLGTEGKRIETIPQVGYRLSPPPEK